MNGSFVIVLLLLLLGLWVLMIRPQRRRQQAQQAMLENVRVGDEILTAGGLYAIVSRVGEDEITVELAPGVDVRLSKRAIAAVLPQETDEEDDNEAPEPESLPEPDEAEEQAHR